MAAIPTLSAPSVPAATADRGRSAVGAAGSVLDSFADALDRAAPSAQASRSAPGRADAARTTNASKDAGAAKATAAKQTASTDTTSAEPASDPVTTSAPENPEPTATRQKDAAQPTGTEAQDPTESPLSETPLFLVPVPVRPVAVEQEILTTGTTAPAVEDSLSPQPETPGLAETLMDATTPTAAAAASLIEVALDTAKTLAPPPVAAAIAVGETLAETLATAAQPLIEARKADTTGTGVSALTSLPSWVPAEANSALIRASRSTGSGSTNPAPTGLIHPDLATLQMAGSDADTTTARLGSSLMDGGQSSFQIATASPDPTLLSGLPDVASGLDDQTPVADTTLTAPSPGTGSAPSATTLSGHTVTTFTGGSTLATSAIQTTALLADQIARRLDARSTRFDMALTPDDLGRVDVSLDIDADGGLTARLAFDNPLAATELRGRAEELRRQLQDAGFTVGSDALTFSERDAGGSNGGSDRRFEQTAGRAFSGAGQLNLDTDLAATPPVWASLSQTPQGVDVKV